MGTLILWGMIGLGIFLGIVLLSLLRMVQETGAFYDDVLCVNGIAFRADPCSVPASEPASPASGGELQPLRELSESAVAL
jgi:hypothetical protein